MNFSKLQPLGWSNYFLQQLTQNADSDVSIQDVTVFRILAIHRNRIEAISEQGHCELLCPSELQPVSQHLAVGDWVVAKPVQEHWRISKIIPAKNRIERLAGNHRQVIAANLDYLWIVTSANDEFNLKRLQRYLTLAYEFSIEPVVILTKTDLSSESKIDEYIDKIRQLKVQLVHAVSVEDVDSLIPIRNYFQEGVTIALLGSSGVGKSTLINSLAGTEQQTRTIREGDDKGKHTTTHRQLLFIDSKMGKAAIIDTPGMRELQLLDAEQGIQHTFIDIVELSQNCKFDDCSHDNEPGCAIKLALSSGRLSVNHLSNYLKLLKEDEYIKRREQGAYAEKQHERAFFKMIRSMNTESW